MPVICELNARRDATSQQLKKLGKVLTDWVRGELGDEGVLFSIDGEGLALLLSGEPPNPLGAQVMQHNEGVSSKQIRRDLGSLFSDRSLRFAVKDEQHCTRTKVIESLREAIPAELVEDILIGDVSWTK